MLGAQNIIEASLEKNVKKIIALSTDKAACPINLYGATKLCADKLFSAANNIVGKKKSRFSIVRYGNVMGSRGSIIPLFKKILKEKKPYFPITDINMSRFVITLKDSAELVFWAIKNSLGGEIIVPKIPSVKIVDLANAIDSKIEKKIIGIRPGEKIFEELISEHDIPYTLDVGKYYVIFNPAVTENLKYLKKFKNLTCLKSYNSNDNNFLSQSQIKKLLNKL